MTRAEARHTWVPYVAAVAGGILVLKVVLVIASDNQTLDGPMGGVSHLGGVVLGLVAAAGLGLRQPGVGRRIGVGFGAALLWVAWIMGLGDLLTPLIEAFSKAEHVVDEVPIGLGGLTLLVAAYLGWSRDQELAPAEPGRTSARATA
ncbi:MAG TPA: hypothetical protein VNA14_00620 [Mycobacteriales bacterium]|nr:hypothetical protein [Mycobacteriales bacterium]